MRFIESSLAGVFIVEPTPVSDERGFFARTYCDEELATVGLTAALSQSSISFNSAKGTLRGLHSQIPPFEEQKLVRCSSGAIFDVAVDVRSESPHFGRWVGVELSARNHRALFIPTGFAHGFITLEDDTEVLYMITANYSAAHGRGFRWNDPAFGIEWPIPPTVMAERDANYPLFSSSGR
jgi:dTDP-4-dehydrorhamnose 3,5-epimerase